MGKLEGKVAIVTGAGRGIGKAIALAFAKEGADVVIAELRPELARKTSKEIKALSREALAVKTDVRVSGEVEAMVNKTLEKFGKIDILVNNAGTAGTPEAVAHAGLPWLIEEEHWDATFDVNMKGIYLCCKYVVPHMVERKNGKIINIASVAGKSFWKGAPLLLHYCASKAAVINFTENLAVVLGPDGINVNDICPVYLWTDLWKTGVGGEAGKHEFEEIVKETTIQGRMTTPEKIAALAVFLASEDGNDITAQSIDVGS
ncbi:MAG: SDR family oxidoreductase [Candidatus Bathyarchaeota archaeon]|nr:SDR family oxidoreductase [Candidatus Bathyarchaeota archaeon]MDH5663274.1 SDR family oxidoreductase [Candidatus Bathyarchaeota archaeon]